MQIVSTGENLHESQILFSGKNKKNIKLSSAEFAQRVVKAKLTLKVDTCTSFDINIFFLSEKTNISK